ncbi:APC family permease [Caenimonas sedimenti]|uniref:APC family permease n=1 Tax=Caenimonas sedimenti TaxID=2596921 RepID=UPI001C986FD9|nr:APC family permease [Caenimonas sedimenti]
MSANPGQSGAAPPGAELIRSIGPFQLTLYGLGSMLGSGIYGLIGQAAGQVGNAVWASFLVAMVAALLTALSYASLGSRYPRAGGAAFVTQKAYGMPLLSFVVGLAVVCSGLASVATQSQVFARNLAVLVGSPAFPVWATGAGFLLVMAALVLRGIRESMWVNVAFTLVEAAGLLLVIAVGIPYWGSVDLLAMPEAPGGGDSTAMLLVMHGAVLTFFAFIGFEDTLNVAEECRDPQRTIPIALVTAMAIGALIYVAVAVTAVSVVPWLELSMAPGPLTEVVARAAPAISPWVFTLVTLFAVANTALVNYITSSRLVYGMARQGLLPPALGHVHPRTRTPRWAALALLAILLPLGLFGSVANLASASVLLLLVVFAVVNGALFVLKGREGEPKGRFEIPRWVPAAGTAICLLLVGIRVSSSDWQAPALAGGLLVGILALYALLRPSGASGLVEA